MLGIIARTASRHRFRDVQRIATNTHRRERQTSCHGVAPFSPWLPESGSGQFQGFGRLRHLRQGSTAQAPAGRADEEQHGGHVGPEDDEVDRAQLCGVDHVVRKQDEVILRGREAGRSRMHSSTLPLRLYNQV